MRVCAAHSLAEAVRAGEHPLIWMHAHGGARIGLREDERGRERGADQGVMRQSGLCGGGGEAPLFLAEQLELGRGEVGEERTGGQELDQRARWGRGGGACD